MSQFEILNPNQPNVTLSSDLQASGLADAGPGGVGYHAAVYGPAGTYFTVTNNAVIANPGGGRPGAGGYSAALILASTGTVINNGTFESGGTGIILQGTTGYNVVANYGLIGGATGAGVIANGQANVENAGIITGGTAAGAVGVALRSGGDVYNKGLIAGGTGVAAGGYYAGYVSNAGVIAGSGGDGIELDSAAPGSVTNTGTVTAADYGVYLRAAGYVTNTGVIEGAKYGVGMSGGAGANDGLIAGNTGVVSSAYTYFINGPNGTIAAAGGDGFYVAAGGGSLANAGTILSAGGAGVRIVGQAATVMNAGLIAGAKAGVSVAAGAASSYIDNTGVIVGLGTSAISAGPISMTGRASAGIEDLGTGAIVNSGQVTDAYGIGIALASGLVANAGTVTGLVGVYVGGGGVVNTGEITAAYFGVAGGYVPNAQVYNAGLIGVSGTSFVQGGATLLPTAVLEQAMATVVNAAAGVIEAGNGQGIAMTSGAVVNYGLIAGALAGVAYQAGLGAGGAIDVFNAGTIVAGGTGGIGVALGAGGLVVDTGTIEGGAYAVSFASGFGDRLVIDAGSVLLGAVNGGGGVLEVAADGGQVLTFTNAGLGQFMDFGALQIDAGAVVAFADVVSAGGDLALVNNGTIIVQAAGDTLAAGTELIGTGTVDLDASSLTLDGYVAAGQVISFTGSGETLAVGDGRKFKGQISDFAAGDTIDLTTLRFHDITATHFVHGVLTIEEANKEFRITFANSGNFGGELLSVFKDGTGTGITLFATAASSPAVSGFLPLHAAAGTAPAPVVTLAA